MLFCQVLAEFVRIPHISGNLHFRGRHFNSDMSGSMIFRQLFVQMLDWGNRLEFLRNIINKMENEVY